MKTKENIGRLLTLKITVVTTATAVTEDEVSVVVDLGQKNKQQHSLQIVHIRCPRINLCIFKTLAPNMSHDSLSSSRPLSNIQKRTISICEVEKLAFDSNMFREQIQDISNKYKYDKRSIATNINRGIASGSLKENQRPAV